MTEASIIELYKAAIAGGATVLGAATIGLFGLVTAKLVTARMETQKQRMELYKALYLERVAAAKQLMQYGNETIVSLAKHKASGGDVELKEPYPEYFELYIAFQNCQNMNEWLFTKTVMDKAQAFSDMIGHAIKADFDELAGKGFAAKLEKSMGSLSKALSDMMLSEDLGSMVKK